MTETTDTTELEPKVKSVDRDIAGDPDEVYRVEMTLEGGEVFENTPSGFTSKPAQNARQPDTDGNPCSVSAEQRPHLNPVDR